MPGGDKRNHWISKKVIHELSFVFVVQQVFIKFKWNEV
jgi:hypothetical protein